MAGKTSRHPLWIMVRKYISEELKQWAHAEEDCAGYIQPGNPQQQNAYMSNLNCTVR